MPPSVSILGPDSIGRGQQQLFTTFDSDDQSDPLRHSWGMAKGQCPADGMVPAENVIMTGDASSFAVTLRDSGDYCLFVTVTDRQGAQSSQTLNVRVENQPPVAVIAQVPRGDSVSTQLLVPLFSALRFTSAGSSDPDVGDAIAGFVWTLTMPDGTGQTPGACAGAASDVCFTVDQPGKHRLALVIEDLEGKPGTDHVDITVADDQPPCIVATTPPYDIARLVRAPTDNLPFVVSQVADDGDPLPRPIDRAYMGSFGWSWRVGDSGPFMHRVSYTNPTWSFPPETFTAGQMVYVRVEALDRKGRSPALMACDRAQPEPLLCGADGCNQWVTWVVEIR